ncbi:hypothetical protein A0J57_18145 [Sphingobium sp. 22B]|uniref:MarR family transcriptional regulator n=1 Tax=unclassified Sphingobium TaxID=2611147 RepID=UPI00078250FE|nr:MULTISPECIES: helix-turn-helix domain-containing protein [unclassified Sphingobium]KXU29943.1 hypothetical protein AXW74_20405 [Sphingobium sp. AM]KYC30913.1 hypothetical protein A0J57_18145 [Sphingobium sp. 22B]OAP30445.1 hypothetical protein A8O16_18435 [Sphingobium sp. 20006FA]
MANDKRTFGCLPRRIFSDPAPSALDIRFCGAIALHDGMSLVKGKGGGCFASMKTLSEEVGCDYTSGSRSLSRLLRWGYVVREPQLYDKRKFTLRVVYDGADSLQDRQPSDEQEVGEVANDDPAIVSEPANNPAEIVGRDFAETRGNLPKTPQHYISLNEEIDFEESNELNSAKRRGGDFEDFSVDAFSDQSTHLDDSSDGAWQGAEESDDNAPSAKELLEVAGWGMDLGQSLARYERLLKSNPQCIDLIECQGQLSKLLDEFGSDNEVRGQIERLWEATWEKHAELQRSDERGGKSAGNRARR